MVKPPTYEWRCLHCDSINAANIGVCRVCGLDVTIRSPSVFKQISADWRELKQSGIPLWRAILGCASLTVGVPLLLIGVALFVRVYFPLDTDGMYWSGSAAIAGGIFSLLAAALLRRL